MMSAMSLASASLLCEPFSALNVSYEFVCLDAIWVDSERTYK